MTTISLEGADGVGKTALSEYLLRAFRGAGYRAAIAPSLNQFIQARTGYDHEGTRQWRLREADPVDNARIVFAAHRDRRAAAEALDGDVILIDRGALTLEAGCFALADLRGFGHSEVEQELESSRDERRDSRHQAIALLYSRSFSESTELLTRREASEDSRYARYLGLLYARILEMESERSFDVTVWTSALDPAEVRHRIWNFVRALPGQERR